LSVPIFQVVKATRKMMIEELVVNIASVKIAVARD